MEDVDVVTMAAQPTRFERAAPDELHTVRFEMPVEQSLVGVAVGGGGQARDAHPGMPVLLSRCLRRALAHQGGSLRAVEWKRHDAGSGVGGAALTVDEPQLEPAVVVHPDEIGL
jgi:hypothetical protein